MLTGITTNMALSSLAGILPPMVREKTGPWSYLSAAALASLTLFVFWALQNYGPESTVRRFHTVVSRICTYLPPDQPYDPRFLKPQDLAELAALTGNAQNTESLASLIDGITRPMIYAKTSYSIPLTDYKTNRQTLVVVMYRSPAGGQNSAVFVVGKPKRTWIIDSKWTALLLRSLNPQPNPAF
jgi:hypothetical protein